MYSTLIVYILLFLETIKDMTETGGKPYKIQAVIKSDISVNPILQPTQTQI